MTRYYIERDELREKIMDLRTIKADYGLTVAEEQNLELLIKRLRTLMWDN